MGWLMVKNGTIMRMSQEYTPTNNKHEGFDPTKPFDAQIAWFIGDSEIHYGNSDQPAERVSNQGLETAGAGGSMLGSLRQLGMPPPAQHMGDLVGVWPRTWML